MKRLLVTALPGLHDVVQLEPTLEALYYKHAPCELVLRTFIDYIPFFEYHPLISNIVVYDETLTPEGFDAKIMLHERGSTVLSTVDRFAWNANVKLLRRTPKIFLEQWPKDGDHIVQCQGAHTLDSWPILAEESSVVLHDPEGNNALREQLSVLASARLVVGPDGWQTQAAAALDARVVMGIDLENEQLRAPFNTTVCVSHTHKDVQVVVNTVMYEKRYPDYMNSGNAADYIKNKAKMYMHSGFVDIGCSHWPIPNGIPIDKGNRHKIEKAEDGLYPGVFSSHCLEHIEKHDEELTLWHRILRDKGIMFLYLPHPRCEPWQALTGSWVGKEHVWNPEPVTLVRFLKEKLGMHIVEYSSRKDPYWSFYVIARKV